MRRSKQAIFRALEDLLATKSYGSITVGDIIDRADVGRTTFYAHFPTKDALFDELCRDIFAHVLAPAPEKEHSFTGRGVGDQLLHALHHLADQRMRLAPLFASPSSHLFWDALAGQLREFFGGQVGDSLPFKEGIPEALYARHLAETFVLVVKWWFERDCAEEPRAVLQVFCLLADVNLNLLAEAGWRADQGAV